MYHELRERLEAVMDNTQDTGWGFHETLIDLYYEIQWIEDDDEEDEDE